MLLLLALACAPPSPAIDVRLDGAWHGAVALVHLPRPGTLAEPTLSRTLTIPAEWAGARAELELAATGWLVHASLDGREVGQATGGLWPVRIELSERLSAGTHTLAITVDGPTSANVLPGVVAEPLSSWLWGMPAAGVRVARGPITLRIGPARRIERVEARLLDGGARVEASAWTVGVEAGAPVSLSLVRDGRTTMTLEAVVDASGLARTTAPWVGPSWPDPAGLTWIVADAGQGARRQAHGGLRAVEQRADGLYVGGVRTYLVASRLAAWQVGSRDALGRNAPALAAVGANAVEIHGEIVSPELLDAADELGLPVLITPRCDGERTAHAGRQDAAAPDRVPPDRVAPDRVAFVNAGDAAARDALRAHPSLLLWTVEAPVDPRGRAREPALDVDGLVVMDERENSNFPDPGLPLRGQARGPTPFYGELPWQPSATPGATLADRLAPVLASHVPSGVGLVLPPFLQLPEAYADRLPVRETVAAAGIPAIDLATPRRGASTLIVRVYSGQRWVEGAPVALTLPAQLPLAAFSDADGVAQFDVDYAGDATVRIPGGPSATVTLVPGTWKLGQWVPHPVEVRLAAE